MKRIFVIIFCLLISNVVISQNTETSATKSKHEFSVYAALGMYNLSYKFDAGSVSGGFGNGAGLGYTYHISDKFGITTGAGYSLYAGKAASDGFSGEYNAPDDVGDDFRFGYTVTGYEETQSAALLTIPVMAQYSVPLGSGSTSFYAAGGLQFGIPISAKATITPGSVTTNGYYAYENQLYENLPLHAFVDGLAPPKSKNDIDLGLATILSLEAGLRFSLSEKLGLYTGLFFDYGLNNIQKTNNKEVVGYHPSPSQFKYNSVLNTRMVDKINLMNVGVKIKLGIRN
jgi:hypothetical protein